MDRYLEMHESDANVDFSIDSSIENIIAIIISHRSTIRHMHESNIIYI